MANKKYYNAITGNFESVDLPKKTNSNKNEKTYNAITGNFEIHNNTKIQQKQKDDGSLFGAFNDGYNFGDISKTAIRGVKTADTTLKNFRKKVDNDMHSFAKEFTKNPFQTIKTASVSVPSGLNNSDNSLNQSVENFFDWALKRDKNRNKGETLQEYSKNNKESSIYHSLNPKYYETKTYKDYESNKLSDNQQKIWNIGENIGNMLPSMAVSSVLPGLGVSQKAASRIGSAVFFTQAQQNYTNEAKQRGYNDKNARHYGLIMGGAEVIVERLGFDELGGLKKLSADSTLKAMGGEALEEFVMPFIDAGVRTLYKEKVNISDTINEAIESAFYGGVVGGIMNLGGKGLVKVDNVVNKINNNQQISNIEMQDAINEINKTNPNYFTEIINDVPEIIKTNIEQNVKLDTEEKVEEPLKRIDNIIAEIDNTKNNVNTTTNTNSNIDINTEIEDITSRINQYENLRENNTITPNQVTELNNLKQQLAQLQEQLNNNTNVPNNIPTVQDIVQQEQVKNNNSTNINLPTVQTNGNFNSKIKSNSTTPNLPTVNDLIKSNTNTTPTLNNLKISPKTAEIVSNLKTNANPNITYTGSNISLALKETGIEVPASFRYVDRVNTDLTYTTTRNLSSQDNIAISNALSQLRNIDPVSINNTNQVLTPVDISQIRQVKGNIPLNQDLLNKYSNISDLINDNINKYDGKIDVENNIPELNNIKLNNMTQNELSNLAIKIFEKYNNSNTFSNDDNKIMVTRGGIKESINKILYNKNQKQYLKEHLQIFSDLGDIIESATLVSQTTEGKARENNKIWNYYLNGLSIDGVNYLFEFDVVSRKNGENHYRVQRLEKMDNKKADSSVGNIVNNNITPTWEVSAFSDNNIPQSNENVKQSLPINNNMQNNEINTNKKNNSIEIPQDPTRESTYKTSEVEKIATILSEKPKIEQKKEKRLKELLTTKILDKGYYIDKLARKYKNPELSAKYDYQMLANGIGNQIIGNGRYDNKGNKIGKSLYEIFEPIENAGLVQEFSEYMYHQHNIDRMSLDGNELKNGEFEKNKPVFGNSVTAEISKNKVEDLLEKYPQFEEWANEIYDYSQADLQMLVDNQVISEDDKNYYNKKYPHYVPIVRAKNNVKMNMETFGKKATIRLPLKTANGGNADLIPLKDALAYRTMQSTKSALTNDFGLELYKTINGDNFEGDSESIETILDENKNASESLTPSTKDSNATFSIYKNGEKFVMNISDEIYEALTPRNSYTINKFNKFNSFRRGILTEYNPTFMVTNPIKDIQDGLINSKRPSQFVKNIPEAFMQIKNKGNLYKLYMANGGGQDTYFNYDKGTNLNAPSSNKSKLPSALNSTLEKINIPKKILNGISNINQVIEMTPRLSEFISSINAGDSIQTAMYNSQEVTTNFKRGGDWTKNLDRNGFTFLNAGVQGFQKQVRNIQEAKMNGIRGYVNLGVKFTVSGLALGLLNHLIWGDDDDYDELSDYVKNNYYIIGKYASGKFVRIPKGRVTSVLQKFFTNLIDISEGKNYDYNGLKDLITNNLLPNNPEENNLISPLIQAMNNETWYGGELVPTRLQNLPNAEQYDETTDSISIWLGNKLNLSPYKLNYLLDQYSGAIGDFILPYLTLEAENSSDGMAGQLIAPITDKFTTDSVLKNKNVSELYDLSDKYTKKSNSVNATVEDKLMNKYINSTKSEMSKLYAEKRNVQSDKMLSNKEKYEQAREIQKRINKLSKDTLNNYRKVEAYSDYGKVNDQEYYLNNKKEWTKVKSEESNELNELNFKDSDKNEYFKTKVKIGTIKSNSELESTVKHQQINELLIDSNLNDEQKGYLYGKYYSSKKVIDTVIKAGINFNEFLKYDSQNFDSDYYINSGKSVQNSRKKKVINYVNKLNLSVAQKALLIKMEYSSYSKYDAQIVNYVNSLNYTKFEKASILKKVGFSSYNRYLVNYINNQNLSIEEKEEQLKDLGFKIRNGRVYLK